MKAAIIEDEIYAFEELKRMLQEIDPSIVVQQHYKSIKEISSSFDSSDIDIIFCDINLPDGNTISVLSDIHQEIPIIFTTAHDEYAIKAFEYNSIDYLLKPITEYDLRRALNKYHTRIKKSKFDVEEIRDLLSISPESIKRNRFLVKSGDKYNYIQTSDIAYLFVEDKMTFARTFRNEDFIIDQSLNEIEPSLDQSFFRVTRNIICSIESILSANKYFNSRLLLKLTPNFEQEIIVSRVKSNELLNWLNC